MTENLVKIGDAVGLKPEEVAIIKNTVAKNTTDTELSFFLMTARAVGLSPFNKEIWCYKDNRGNLIVFAGRDGFLKKAQQDPRWNGMVSAEVRENDVCEIDYFNGTINHKPKVNTSERGQIVGAYAVCRPRDCELATIEYVEMKAYNKNMAVWSSHPADMIKKVAETRVLKKAYGISGLQSEYEFHVKDEVVIPIDTEPKPDKEALRIIEFIASAETTQQLEQVEPYLKNDEQRELFKEKQQKLEL